MRRRGPDPKHPTALSDGEWAAMQCVWARSAAARGGAGPGPCAADEAQVRATGLSHEPAKAASEGSAVEPVGPRDGVTARDVFDELRDERGWAYTTVKTVLDRLVEKGVLAVSLEAHVSRYAPLITEAEARRSAVRALVDRAFDGAFGPLLHMLAGEERLSAKDRDALRALLEEPRDPPAGGRK